MTDRSVTHGSFTIERLYDAKPARVFQAFADPIVKRRWFGSPDGGGENHLRFEFAVGGHETSKGVANEQTFELDARYWDIVSDQRIIYTYDMHLNGQRISVSLATIEMHAEGDKTRFTLTEHGVFLDGLDTPKQRQDGTIWLMDRLGQVLKADPLKADAFEADAT